MLYNKNKQLAHYVYLWYNNRIILLIFGNNY